MFPRFFTSALAAVLVAVVAVVSTPPATAEVARERVIVQVRDGDPAAVARDVIDRHGGQVSHVYRHAISGFAMELPTPAVASLRADPRVVTVEPDHRVRMFAEVPTGVARSAIDTNATADIDGNDDRVDVGIAVLDTGIDSAHEDLNVVGGVDCTKEVTCTQEQNPVDDNGHGTHVAGTAAAIDDGAGVVGAAPGARLWSVKVLNEKGEGELSWVIAGLNWVANNAEEEEIDVANTSFGCDPSEPFCSNELLDAAVSGVVDAGVVVVAAAGNSSEDIEGHALTAHPEVITVSAMADLDGAPGGEASETCHPDVKESDDTFASFSNYGDAVDLAAPGVCIVSTVPGGGLGLSSGTSMAAPHVAGAAGLYILEGSVTRNPDRSTTVRDGLIADWSVAQGSGCGFTGGITDEPMLYLIDCSLGASSNTAPTVTIDEPADGTRTTVGSSITFAGTASDAEDGGLTSKIAWSSDLDGNLGTGGQISAELTEGSHVVTARVRDSAGAKATDTVTVHIDPEPSLDRLAGRDRIATGVEVSRAVFADGAPAAVVAHAGDFPDALAATPLAVALGAPVLLNVHDRLHEDVAAELDRLGVSTVYVMGGTAAQSSQVDQDLRDRQIRPVRVAGTGRFETAAAAADAAVSVWESSGLEVSSNAVLALGTDFPDALSGGPLAGARRAPLLLTGRDQLPDTTVDALRELGMTSVTIMGGEAAVSGSVASQLEERDFTVTRVAGATRFETAVAAADAAVRAGAAYRSVVVASGRDFPDALTAAPAVSSRGGVLLLSERDDLPGPSSEALRAAENINWVRLAGGTAVLTDRVRDQVAEATGISP